ncbi:uncharacterized protein LOC128249945 isoform X2 [Octopus bimaculoides]|uniref:uncharacterized protein LOC128249945 isoform X2 n=1 Tax=Octopus bimaculoides TaxID=37653 RepID=UPI0022E03BA1|nr:uncharacterized protein LOC128249945 isoform X2 [Octopus bimaculoides]
MNLSIFIFILFFGVSFSRRCDELAKRHCAVKYEAYRRYDPDCTGYKKFLACFHGQDGKCYGFFKYQPNCMHRNTSNKKVMVTFHQVFLTVLGVTLLIKY